MPTYDYKCDACGHEFSKEQRISEKPIKACPECRKQQARRMISGTGNFLLKGGGWESDLYSGPSNRKKSESKPEAKSDAKPDAKPAKPSKKPSASSAPAAAE